MAIKLRALVKYPSRLEGDTGIEVTKANGVYTVALGLEQFAEATAVADPDATQVLLMTPSGSSMAYERMDVNDFVAQGAPIGAEYLVAAPSAGLTGERVTTDTASITWDNATPGEAKATRAALTGDVTAAADSNATTIANDAVTFARMQDIPTDSLIGRDAAGTGDPESITLNSTLEMTGAGALQRAALTGDVTAAAGSNATTIPNDVVTFAKMQNISTDRLLGRDAAGAGDPEELTVSGGIEFTGSGGIQTSAFTGDVTKAAGGTATTIANDAVTDAKLRDSAALSVVGRAAGTAGDPADISTTAGTAGVLREASGGLSFGPVASAGLSDDAVTFAKMQNIATDTLIGRDTAGTGDPENITLNATLSMTGTGALQRSALTGDVTASAGSNAITIANSAVSNAKLANMPAYTLKLNATGAAAAPTDTKISALTDRTGFGAGDKLIIEESTGELRKVDYLDLPGAGSLGGSTGATDNRVLRADGIGGATVQNSPVGIDDSGNVTGVVNLAASTIGGSVVASEVQQETGTATNLIVTPGNQHYHFSALKSWGRADQAGTLQGGYNISSVTDVGAGIVAWTFTIPFPTTNTLIMNGGVFSSQDRAITFDVNSTAQVRTNTWNTAGALADSTLHFIQIAGVL